LYERVVVYRSAAQAQADFAQIAKERNANARLVYCGDVLSGVRQV